MNNTEVFIITISSVISSILLFICVRSIRTKMLDIKSREKMNSKMNRALGIRRINPSDLNDEEVKDEFNESHTKADELIHGEMIHQENV